MTYAGFWRRAGALMVDVLIGLCVFGAFWLLTRDRARTIAGETLPQALMIAYAVFMHGRFGQTLGKMATKVQVRMLDGTGITWRAAWLRSSVDILFAIVGIAAMFYTFRQLPAGAVHADWKAWGELLEEHMPVWQHYVIYMAMAWGWSELLVMLTNEKRRALHDFIAGTVVVRIESARSRPGEAMGDAELPERP